jgi:hypothetical protein
MYRKIIEANDSCLFNAIGLALNNSLKDSTKLRKIVADKVISDQT